MEIRTEDGTLLKVKEPIVLNQEGEVILEPNSTSQDSFKSYSFNFQAHSRMKPLTVILGLGLIIGLFTVGTVIFGLIAAFFLSLAILRSLFRLIGFRS